MEILGKIAAIPALLIGAALAVVAVVALIMFHDAVGAIVTAFATVWIPSLLSIFGDLVKALLAALQKA
jgi:hypothetical protein